MVGCRDEVGRGERCVLAQVFRGFLSMGWGQGSPGRLVDAWETEQAVLVGGEVESGRECVWGSQDRQRQPPHPVEPCISGSGPMPL